MNIFITGTESFVGQRLIKALDLAGHQLSGIDVIPPKDLRFHQCDLHSANLSQYIPLQTDIVIHLAALSRDPDCKNKGYDCFHNNVMGTLALIDAAEQQRVKQFIFASSEWVYDNCRTDNEKDETTFIDINNHHSEYALSKLVSEQNLRQKFRHGFCDTTILRFGIIYGPRPANWSAVESLFFQVRDQQQLTVGSLKTARSFIHVDDVIEGIVTSFSVKGFEIINLQGSALICLEDIIRTAESIWQKKILITESDANNPNVRNVSNKKALTLLNWQARIDLPTGLRSLIP
jgi:nucleoside-diphosphate-sugar epimerase